jgi:glycosyltransferase involved in cell wall biosynthesis
MSAMPVLNIAIVGLIEFPDGGAVSHRISMMARGLASRGHKTYIVVPYKFAPGPLVAEDFGVNIVWAGYGNREFANSFLGKLKKRLLLIKSVTKLLATKLDWLILYDLGLDNFPFLLLANKFNCQVAAENCDVRLVSYNSTKDNLIKKGYEVGERLLTPNYQINFAVTTYLEEHLKMVAPQVPTLVIPAIIDVDRFNYSSTRAQSFRIKWGLENDPVISYTGSLQPIHGLEILLKAIDVLRRSGQTCKLLVCGKFVYEQREQEIMKLVEEYHLQKHVVFPGFLPTDEVVAALSASDILVSPQIDHVANMAGFPQKIAEYLAMGKPVVASATGDIPLYLRDGDNALLCQPGDPESLASALQNLIENPTLRLNLSKRARETALACFDCRMIADHIASKFGELRRLFRGNSLYKAYRENGE